MNGKFVCKDPNIMMEISPISSSSTTRMWPCDTHTCRWPGSSLDQIMACHLFGAKPLSKPMLGSCQFDPNIHPFNEILFEIQKLSFNKMHLKIVLKMLIILSRPPWVKISSVERVTVVTRYTCVCANSQLRCVSCVIGQIGCQQKRAVYTLRPRQKWNSFHRRRFQRRFVNLFIYSFIK